MAKPRIRLRKSLVETRNNLVRQIWATRRFTMEETGKIFRLTTAQIFDIIKEGRGNGKKNKNKKM